MKRQNALFTKYGFIFTILFLVGMGLSIWYSGGKAFSPGDLSAKQQAATTWQGYESHADFEGQCGLCHAPLETTQDKLCLACHADINQQMTMKFGTHHLIEDVYHCASCHPDHRGREFDPASNAYTLFDHSRTKYSLVWHQIDFDAKLMDCTSCHAVESDFSASNAACELCHSGQDPRFILQHIQEFNQNCLLCHDGADRMTNLDHHNTAFPLDGKHFDVGCIECHKIDNSPQHQGMVNLLTGSANVAYQIENREVVSDPFSNTPTECAQCHSEPQVHLGFFLDGCDECHMTSGWVPANLEDIPFEHTQNTGFNLAHHSRDYQNQPLTCHDCHQNDLYDFDPQKCITCHSEGDERAIFLVGHREQFGDSCLECHDGADRMSNFDHASFFPLDGRHANLECSTCHQNKIFGGTATECVQCHAEPAIHAGFFGLQCQYCHTAQAWIPAQLRAHRFPLDHGGQGEIECQACHPGNYIVITCYGCHDHQPDPIAANHAQAGIALDPLANCANCHPDGVIEADE